MHTFSFLQILSIALFPITTTRHTTEGIWLLSCEPISSSSSPSSLSRDAITTVVDQSLKSLRIVSYFFFLFLFLPWSSHLFLLFFFFSSIWLCCSSVLLMRDTVQYVSLSLFFLVRFFHAGPVSLSPRYIISCSVQYIVQLIQHGVSKHFSILAIISYIRFHLTLSLIRWRTADGVMGRKAADDSAAAVP